MTKAVRGTTAIQLVSLKTNIYEKGHKVYSGLVLSRVYPVMRFSNHLWGGTIDSYYILCMPRRAVMQNRSFFITHNQLGKVTKCIQDLF